MTPLRANAMLTGIVMAVVIATAPIPAGPASAAAIPKPPKPIVCQAMSSGASAPAVVSGCDRRGITGRSGSLAKCPTGACITWETAKEFDVTSTSTVPTTSRCPSGLIEVDTVGRVVKASGAGTKPLIGATVAYDSCLTNQITVVDVELVPGTRFTIG